MVADPKFLRDENGQHHDAPAQTWFESHDNDGSADAEYAIPAGAIMVRVFSSVAAWCAPVAVASLDISGAGVGCYIPAGQWSPPIFLKDRTVVGIKAASGNLAILSVAWGGRQA